MKAQVMFWHPLLRPIIVSVMTALATLVLQSQWRALTSQVFDSPISTAFDSPLPTPSVPAWAASPPAPILPTPQLSTEAQIALNYISQKYGIPVQQLAVVNEHYREYIELSRAFRAFSLFDPASRRFFQLMVDLKDHTVVEDVVGIEQAEADAARQKYGKLEPALYKQLQTLQDNDVVTVTITVAGDPHTSVSELEVAAMATVGAKYPEARVAIDRNTKPMDVEDPVLAATIEWDYSQSMEAVRTQRLQPFVEMRQALAQALEARGVIILASDGMGVTARLTKKDILVIEQRTDVGAIYLYPDEVEIISLTEQESASEDSSALGGITTPDWTMLACAVVFAIGVGVLLQARMAKKRG